MDINFKRYGLYLIRWQLSTPILAGVIILLSTMDALAATVVANLIGGLSSSGSTASSSPRKRSPPSGRSGTTSRASTAGRSAGDTAW